MVLTGNTIVLDDTFAHPLSSHEAQSCWKTSLTDYSLHTTQTIFGRHPNLPTLFTRNTILLEYTLTHVPSSQETQYYCKTPWPTYCLHTKHKLVERHPFLPTLFTWNTILIEYLFTRLLFIQETQYFLEDTLTRQLSSHDIILLEHTLTSYSLHPKQNLPGRHPYPPTLFTWHTILLEDTRTHLLTSHDTQSCWKKH